MDRVYASVKCSGCKERVTIDTTSVDSAVQWLSDQERLHRACANVPGQLWLIQS